MRGLAHLGEVGIFAEQAVARVDGIYIRDFGGADYGGNVQIALTQPRRAYADGLVGKAHVERVAVGGAVYGDSLDAELFAGADNA